mmetsp:Transcript_31227/g.64713  ORF Transcript_31227/g.64713 Transcript_31227/m.64713 type:complete len:212 (-) Transcript_31227:778-1413(-)
MAHARTVRTSTAGFSWGLSQRRITTSAQMFAGVAEQIAKMGSVLKVETVRSAVIRTALPTLRAHRLSAVARTALKTALAQPTPLIVCSKSLTGSLKMTLATPAFRPPAAATATSIVHLWLLIPSAELLTPRCWSTLSLRVRHNTAAVPTVRKMDRVPRVESARSESPRRVSTRHAMMTDSVAGPVATQTANALMEHLASCACQDSRLRMRT